MQVHKTELPGVLIIEPKVFGDERGYFMETWSQPRYAENVTSDYFVQDNVSFSRQGVLRGLHYQRINTQAKLVYVLMGEVFDVAVDIRRSSPSFGKWVGLELSEDNHRQLWIPPGFAHGFLVLSDSADFLYKTTDYYAPEYERCIAWNDATIDIEWSLQNEPQLSSKDKAGTAFSQAELFS